MSQDRNQNQAAEIPPGATVHYRVSVVVVTETAYEVWAESEDAAMAIAEGDPEAHERAHRIATRVHPAQAVEVDRVVRRCEC